MAVKTFLFRASEKRRQPLFFCIPKSCAKGLAPPREAGRAYRWPEARSRPFTSTPAHRQLGDLLSARQHQAHTDKHSPRTLLERRGREAQGEQQRGGRDAQQRRHFRGLRRELELDVIWAGPWTAGRIWGPGAAGRMIAGDRVPFTKGESGEAGGARPG